MGRYTRFFIDDAHVFIAGIAAIVDRLTAGESGDDDMREGERLAHSVKGMALFEEQPVIVELAWAMERGFRVLARDPGAGGLVGRLAAAVPILSRVIDQVEAGESPRVADADVIAGIERELGERRSDLVTPPEREDVDRR